MSADIKIVARSDNDIAGAARALETGELVAFPTETVYGLGANALDSAAVAAVFAAKRRPRFNPLIVHVADLETARNYAQIGLVAQRLAEAFWPGPLSMVLPRRDDCRLSPLVTAGLETVALRSPAHPIAQRLLRRTGLPIAAPSANRSGKISPTRAEDVRAELGDLPAAILDGGPCEIGLESTVVRVADGEVEMLRFGAVTREDIEAALGRPVKVPWGQTSDAPVSPGQLSSHYAPEAKVRLNVSAPAEGEALLAFGPDVPTFEGPVVNLSESGDLKEAAANFFAALRTLDQSGATTIAAMPIPNQGLGEAINDRLARAAAERPNA
ncbi:L-threonylcarbamoyladenylate synthase [Methyloligella sp. 2.7D]|uniref:L-threonylcarbamoyladenylate synthase n=1 Tax=unclassified Methyloligella TaxID=2625955 RepID=UPI001FF06E78|nr:L-threonylcarbamoyladenylate synthase [Methyloligella sp. GL2]